VGSGTTVRCQLASTLPQADIENVLEMYSEKKQCSPLDMAQGPSTDAGMLMNVHLHMRISGRTLDPNPKCSRYPTSLTSCHTLPFHLPHTLLRNKPSHTNVSAHIGVEEVWRGVPCPSTSCIMKRVHAGLPQAIRRHCCRSSVAGSTLAVSFPTRIATGTAAGRTVGPAESAVGCAQAPQAAAARHSARVLP